MGRPRPVDERSPYLPTVGDTHEIAPTPLYLGSRAEIEPFFDGLTMVEPALVMLHEWRPDPEDPGPVPTRWMYGGVAVKPRPAS